MTTTNPPSSDKYSSPAAPARSDRPGCVTLYALLLGGGAVLSAIGGVIWGLDMNAPGLVLGALIFAAFEFALSRGMWNQREWARVTLLVLQGLSLLIGIVQLVSGYPEAFVGVAISGALVVWLASNKKHFY